MTCWYLKIFEWPKSWWRKLRLSHVSIVWETIQIHPIFAMRVWCNEINKRFLCIFSHSNSFLNLANCLNSIWFTKTRRPYCTPCIEYIIFFGGGKTNFNYILCLLKFLIGNWIDMRSIYSHAFLIRLECMGTLILISFYCSLNKCHANRNVCKSLFPVFGSSKMRMLFFFALSEFKWNFTLFAQIGLCTWLKLKMSEWVCIWVVRVTKLTSARLVVHKWTNKQKFVCRQLFGRKNFSHFDFSANESEEIGRWCTNWNMSKR